MGRVEELHQHVENFLRQYADMDRQDDEIETQLIVDREGGHYQLMSVGWQKKHRVFGAMLHIDVKDGKIWIQHNSTEIPVAEELAERGIPKESIVIGFHSPFMRQFTEFAVS